MGTAHSDSLGGRTRATIERAPLTLLERVRACTETTSILREVQCSLVSVSLACSSSRRPSVHAKESRRRPPLDSVPPTRVKRARR